MLTLSIFLKSLNILRITKNLEDKKYDILEDKKKYYAQDAFKTINTFIAGNVLAFSKPYQIHFLLKMNSIQSFHFR